MEAGSSEKARRVAKAEAEGQPALECSLLLRLLLQTFQSVSLSMLRTLNVEDELTAEPAVEDDSRSG